MVPTMMLPPPSQLVFDYVCVCGGGGGGSQNWFHLVGFSVHSFRNKIWKELWPLTLES